MAREIPRRVPDLGRGREITGGGFGVSGDLAAVRRVEGKGKGRENREKGVEGERKRSADPDGNRPAPIYTRKYHIRFVYPQVQKMSSHTQIRCTCGYRPLIHTRNTELFICLKKLPVNSVSNVHCRTCIEFELLLHGFINIR